LSTSFIAQASTITVSNWIWPLYFCSYLEDAGERLHDVGLVHQRDLLAAGGDGVLERVLEDAPATGPRVDAGGHGHGVRIVVDRHIVLMADVQALEVLAHHHQIDLVEAAAGHHGERGAQVGVELEFFAQAHIAAAVAAAGRRLQRPLQRQARAANAGQRGLGQRIARRGDAFEAGDLAVPLKGRAQRVQRGQRGVDDLRADAIPRDQGGGNGLAHGAILAG